MSVKRVEEASDCTVGMAIGVPHKDCPPGKYLARVARLGRDVDVRSETVTIRNAETMVMGTTGRTPNTVVPDAARLTTSMPPHERSDIAAPGGGAGTAAWISATASTAAAVQTVVARAPHFVLPFQKTAAASRGASAE